MKHVSMTTLAYYFFNLQLQVELRGGMDRICDLSNTFVHAKLDMYLLAANSNQ